MRDVSVPVSNRECAVLLIVQQTKTIVRALSIATNAARREASSPLHI